MARKKKDIVTQPYKNMAARKGVLMSGFVLTLIGFGLVVAGLICLFFGVHVGANPTELLMALYLAGAIACFVGIIFAVAGANTKKSIARLSFALGALAFIFGVASVIVMLALNILPIEAFGRL